MSDLAARLSILNSLIGNTPAIELADPLIPKGKRLIMKIEAMNPTYSIKDRTAFGMINAAFQAGTLHSGSTVVETTSGNFGRSLAMMGAILHLKTVIIVDSKVSQFLLNWYRAYGAKVIVVDRALPYKSLQDARQALLERLRSENPDWVHLDQYNSLTNRDYHAQTTANEIRPLCVDAICGAVGTGGHLSGIASALKADNQNVTAIAADIEGSAIFCNAYCPYLTNGVGLVRAAANLDKSNLDWFCIVNDREAFSICRLIAKEHGLLFGGSSGVALIGALNALRFLDIKTMIAIMPDSGIAYLDQIYDDEFLERRQISLLSRAEIEAALTSSRLRRVENNDQ